MNEVLPTVTLPTAISIRDEGSRSSHLPLNVAGAVAVGETDAVGAAEAVLGALVLLLVACDAEVAGELALAFGLAWEQPATISTPASAVTGMSR
jgi:hypothetical protein